MKGRKKNEYFYGIAFKFDYFKREKKKSSFLP